MNKQEKNKYWFVDFPTSQYNEDVMELASKNRVEVVDSQFRGTIHASLCVLDESSLKLTKKSKAK